MSNKLNYPFFSNCISNNSLRHIFHLRIWPWLIYGAGDQMSKIDVSLSCFCVIIPTLFAWSQISNIKFQVQNSWNNWNKQEKMEKRESRKLWYVQYSIITSNRLQWFVENDNLDQLHNLLFISVLHANLPIFHFHRYIDQLQFDFLFFSNWFTFVHIYDTTLTKI